MRCLRTWLLAAAACQLPLQAAEASPLPAGAFLRACKIVVPEQTPLFPGSPAQAADAETADDESDDGDDDDEDEDDAEDESVPGFISPGTGTCVAVSGVLSLGTQSDSFRASPLTRATGLVPPNGLSHPGSLSFRIETAKTLASGLYLASYFAGGLAGSAVLGQIFDRFGWSACVAGIGMSLALAALLAFKLRPIVKET